MKNMQAAGSTYDGLLTWVENCSVHGTVRNHPQMSQRGTRGRCRHAYHASAPSAANDSRFSSTNGASGTGAIFSGTPTSSPCSAPGISLLVQTTSGPKIRPLSGRVVTQPQQEDLRLVFEEELARQPEEEPEEEERDEDESPALHATMMPSKRGDVAKAWRPGEKSVTPDPRRVGRR